MLEYIKAQISLSWQRRVTGTIDIMLYFFLFLLFGVSVSDLGSYLYDLGVEVIPYFLQPMNASVSHEIISKLGKTLVDLSAFPHPTPQWSWKLSTVFLFVFFLQVFSHLADRNFIIRKATQAIITVIRVPFTFQNLSSGFKSYHVFLVSFTKLCLGWGACCGKSN